MEEYEAEAAETQELMSAEERHAIASNPFARLENGQAGRPYFLFPPSVLSFLPCTSLAMLAFLRL